MGYHLMQLLRVVPQMKRWNRVCNRCIRDIPTM